MTKELFDKLLRRTAWVMFLFPREIMWGDKTQEHVEATWMFYYACFKSGITKLGITRYSTMYGVPISLEKVGIAVNRMKFLVENDEEYERIFNEIMM